MYTYSTYGEILRVAMAQSAIDMSCSPEDFTLAVNKTVVSRPATGARKYLSLPFFCNIVSYGSNTVAAADERVTDTVERYINSRQPYRCFETPDILLLDSAFRPYGYTVCFQALYWLPEPKLLKNADSCPFSVKKLDKKELDPLCREVWHNALSPKRPELDILGFGAYDGEDLVGLAACSADCELMWQIGIDVLPSYRRKGIASALTRRLAYEILVKGKIPFYCCAWSNIASARNAFSAGFRPAWTELTALPIDKAAELITPIRG